MALPELPQSRYATAAATRARTIGDIALDKYDAGSAGVMGSYAQAAKEKMAASSMRMKERFDPLNMVQGLTGSRLLTTAAGRMMGRKSEDVDYFRDKATQRDTARNPGGYQDIAAAAKNTVNSENQKKLLESQTKINNLVLTGKTTLYPKEDIVDGLNDLYDLIDARMPIGGNSGRYIPDANATATKPAPANPRAEKNDGGLEIEDLDIGRTATKFGKKALGAVGRGASNLIKGGGRFAARAAPYIAEALGTGGGASAASLVAPAAIVGAGAAYIGFKGFQVQKATPDSVPDFDQEDDPQYAYLQDLVKNVEPRQYMSGLAGSQGPEKVPELLAGVANRVPPEDRKDFATLIHSKTDGKEPQDQLYGLREAIDEYVAKKVADIKKSKGKAGRWDAEGARVAQVTQDIEQNRADTMANTAALKAKADAMVPSAYKNDILRFQRDQRAASGGDAKAIARLKDAGVDAQGKPLQSTQTVAPVPAVENSMNNLDQARAATSTQQAAAPVIINAGGGGQAQMQSSQAAPTIPPPGTATTNSSVNRFEDKLMGGNADYVP